MKYKVGDKVRVRIDLKENTRYGEQIFSPDMRPFLGKIVEISEILIEDSYHIKETDGGYGWFWTDEMFEPVEEMSAEEAISLQRKICRENECTTCPIQKIPNFVECEEYMIEHPEEVVKALKQWKADHEKKPIETEFACIVRVIEDLGDSKRCVHEEDVTEVKDETFKMTMKRILEEYCKEHEGKFFTVYEEICRVKE